MTAESGRQAAEALCRAVLQLARTAVARLLLRDHDEGFLGLGERERTLLIPRAGVFAGPVEAMATAWRAAGGAPAPGWK